MSFISLLYAVLSQGDSRLLQELSRTNELLHQLISDMKRTMQHVDNLEGKVGSSSGSKAGLRSRLLVREMFQLR